MIVSRIPIQNVTDHDFNIHVEPWGEQHVLVPDDSLDVVFYSQKRGLPQILCGDAEISIYGWEGCRFFVLKKNLCVEQPSLVVVIRQLCSSHGIEESEIQLEQDFMEYLQVNFDASPAWDEAGRDAVFSVVSKLAPLLEKLNDDAVLWSFCEAILYSRGVFLYEDKTRKGEFLELFRHDATNLVDEITERLIDWYEATCSREERLDIV